MPDLISNTVDPHNGFIVRIRTFRVFSDYHIILTRRPQLDGVTSYVDWGIKHGFGVVDANVPRYITHPEDLDAFMPRATEKSLQQQIQELVCYIWDNYLQLYDVEELFLLGIGDAYLGVKVLLTNRRTYLPQETPPVIDGYTSVFAPPRQIKY